MQRAVNPALVLSIAPLCFIFKRTSKKWFPIVLSCSKSRTESDEKPAVSTEGPSNSDKSEQALLGNGTFLIIVPKRRLTWQRKHSETLGTGKKKCRLHTSHAEQLSLVHDWNNQCTIICKYVFLA